ncbi:hypothetical protein [Cerasicoccus arenae]|uniref:Uncharacterized protein n=1 Tax=Cerasicoccus arenae TaxID=424488 RepID=A0A8J3DLC8_9BACT|nr:hypothetical protein [Cerasicoccus arenae]MBK1860077.1 hypothetical protein [Cerasicoccus arenae]GHC14154.1 hypothetical protein GCM10007047_34230 [Cerasicoccus arenae]
MKPKVKKFIDAFVLYGYLGIPSIFVLELFFNGAISNSIQDTPLWVKIFLLIFLGLPMIIVPFVMWAYAMGKSDEIENKKEGTQLYYLAQLIGDKIGLLYYWRYIRTGKDPEFFGPLKKYIILEQDA